MSGLWPLRDLSSVQKVVSTPRLDARTQRPFTVIAPPGLHCRTLARGEPFVVGKEEVEYRPGRPPVACGAATHTDQAAVLFDDLLAHPKPQAGADGFLGGEERFKDAAAHFG